jgi:hypothetical protein
MKTKTIKRPPRPRLVIQLDLQKLHEFSTALADLGKSTPGPDSKFLTALSGNLCQMLADAAGTVCEPAQGGLNPAAIKKFLALEAATDWKNRVKILAAYRAVQRVWN